jgi:hypothetical protein
MSASVGEGTRPSLGWPFVAIWGGALLFVLIGFWVTVVALNATVYSAAGFARGYVAAVDRGDTSSALTLAGVTPTDQLADSLLEVPSLGGIDDVTEAGDVDLGDDTHAITLSYSMQGTAATAASPAQSQFVVQRAGTRFGLFHAWRFVQAPTASLDVTPQHDARFTVDGREVTTDAPDVATRFTVLAPSRFELGHSSRYLEAPTVEADVVSVGATSGVSVEVQPREAFVEAVQDMVDRQLDEQCVTQQVLLPAGCPFGRQVDDRVTDDPTWTVPEHPVVTIVPGPSGQWQVPGVAGTAHLVVGAQSLFDGERYTIDEDVPFTVTYLMRISTADELTFE